MKNTFSKLTIYITLFIGALLFGNIGFAQCSINTSISYHPTPNICSGDTLTLSATANVSGVSFTWSGPNNYTSSGQNAVLPSVTTNHTGVYKVVVTKTGCASDSDSVSITVNQTPTPPLLPKTPICSGDTLDIDLLQFPKNTTAIGWAPNGYSDTVIQSPLTFPNAEKHTHSGEYKIVASSATCTSDTLRVIIPQYEIVNRPDTPVASIAQTPLCSGDTLRLTGSSNSTVDGYYWTGPNQQNYIAKDVTINGYNIVGKQQFILHTDSNGCFSVPDTLDIDVHPIKSPSVSIQADPSFIVAPNVLVTLTALPVDSGANVQYQWRKNGADISGETGKTLSVVTTQSIQQGDLISVWINTTPTCAPTSTAVSNLVSINILLGINEVENENELQLYPNPVQDVLTIKAKKDISSIELTNLTGNNISLHNRLQQINKASFKLNTNQLPSGIYFLKTNLGIYRFVKTN